MRFCALTTGSSGNCYYIENSKEALIIDCGISASRVSEAMLNLGEDLNKVKAILLTHEHTDHKRGADVLARKLSVPIYATEGTHIKSIFSENKLNKTIENDAEFKIGQFNIRSIPKNHSAADPVSFLIEHRKKKALFMTDLGKICKESSEAICEADFIFLESNHDVKMLEEGPYLPFHKKWVLSDKGHLSNLQAALAMLEFGNQKVQGVVLSHLSRTNNTSILAEKTFRNIMKERRDFKADVFVSEKDIPTKMFEL